MYASAMNMKLQIQMLSQGQMNSSEIRLSFATIATPVCIKDAISVSYSTPKVSLMVTGFVKDASILRNSQIHIQLTSAAIFATISKV